jgi:hypothetical protein
MVKPSTERVWSRTGEEPAFTISIESWQPGTMLRFQLLPLYQALSVEPSQINVRPTAKVQPALLPVLVQLLVASISEPVLLESCTST